MKIYEGQFYEKQDQNVQRGVGLGNFDGVHAGHAALIRMLSAACRERHLRSMVYTFENHPSSVLWKDRTTPLILDVEQKIEILKNSGVDELFLEHFDEAYAHTAAEAFVKQVIVDKLHEKLVVFGYDYTYGDHGKGTAEELISFGKQYGFEVLVVPPVTSYLPSTGEHVTVSSTILRKQIAAGRVGDFKALTGRYYSIPGRVEQGRKVGKSLGFPTANILPKEGFALPDFGVYATYTKTGGKRYPSITNIGNNPTFQNITAVTIETYLLGFKGELYGHAIEVEFIRKIRGEVAFPTKEALSRQLQQDVGERRTMSEDMERIYDRDGIEIYHLPNEKFKTTALRIVLCDTLSKDRAYRNALIPAILNAGCTRYPTLKSVTERLQELYGTNLSVAASSIGEVQYSEFILEYTDPNYFPEADGLENDIIELAFDLITDPVTEEYHGKKGFVGSVFERERTNRDNQIRSLVNDKQEYALQRCAEIMCAGEPYSVHYLGALGDGDGLTPTDLYDYYENEYLRKSTVKIFYSGKVFPVKLLETAVRLFQGGDRKPIGPGYTEKREIPPETVKYVEDRMNVTQGKLFLGYRTNMDPNSPDYYATALCNAILGQGSQSKLFVNVREKNSLAYYAATYMNKFKGVLFAFCAIDPQNKDRAQELILEQVAAIKRGEISQEEYGAAVKMFRNDLTSYGDNQTQLMNYYFNQSFLEHITSLSTYIEEICKVDKAEIAEAAGRIVLDTVYFLTREDNTDDTAPA